MAEIDHQDKNSGNAWWDMRTVNNQEIAPGLYLYHIQKINQDNGKNLEEIMGKFAVIR